MEKRTREIIALVLLIALGLLAAGAMAWYLLVGHNWNQAATHIDDMVGSMDGYTVVVYDGVTNRPRPAEREKGSAFPKSEDGAGNRTSAPASSAAPAGGASPTPASAESAPAPASSAGSSSASVSAESRSAGIAGSASSASPTIEIAGVSVNAPSSKRIDAASVAQSYRDKGASVILLGLDAMHEFAEPEILFRGGKRIGVFSFAGKYRMHYVQLRASIRYLQQHSVDFIIAVGRDRALLKSPLYGIGLLVLYSNAGIPEVGEFRRSTFCVDSPYIGQTQAVIIAPSGVMTSRTIGER